MKKKILRLLTLFILFFFIILIFSHYCLDSLIKYFIKGFLKINIRYIYERKDMMAQNWWGTTA